MARRYPGLQWRFLKNTNPVCLEIHDLDNEQPQCQIEEIIKAGHAQHLEISDIRNLQIWITKNPKYDGCKYCLPLYHRK